MEDEIIAYSGVSNREQTFKSPLPSLQLDHWIHDVSKHPYDKQNGRIDKYPIDSDVSLRCIFSYSDKSKSFFILCVC